MDPATGSEHRLRPGAPTRLQEALTEPGLPRSEGPLRAFALARGNWLKGRRVDMSSMAKELGVSRVTLYRWVGSREQLLVEVIWFNATRSLDDIEKRVGERGGERIVQVVTQFIDVVISNPGMRFWLANEGESAMRLLTRYETDFQPRLVGWLEAALRTEEEAGELDLPVDLDQVAFAIEQLIESYIYLDLITGEEPDAARAEPILRLLLR